MGKKKKYSDDQIDALIKLRRNFSDKGFIVYTIIPAHRKHPMEFIVAKPEGSPVMSPTICRLFRGGIRIQAFGGSTMWENHIVEHLKLGISIPLYFSKRTLNPTYKGNDLAWRELAPEDELIGGPKAAIEALKRAGAPISRR